MRYQISITRAFRARHAIRLPDGSWEKPHSHRWTLEVTVGSARLDAIETVMDFHDLERLVDGLTGELTAGPQRDINRSAVFASPTPPRSRRAASPTAERIAQWFAQQINRQLPRTVRLVRIRLGEAPGCTAIFEPGE